MDIDLSITTHPMKQYRKRHSNWYEIILLSWHTRTVAGLGIISMLTSFASWGHFFPNFSIDTHLNSIVTIVFSIFASTYTLHRIKDHSPSARISQVIPITTSIFLVAYAILFFFRFDYSRPALLSGYVFTLAWLYLDYFLLRKYLTPRYAVVPFGRALNLVSASQNSVQTLMTPSLDGKRYDGIIADFSATEMGPIWQKFLAICAINQIPVFNVQQAQETITGRIQVDHLYENNMGSLIPSPMYAAAKRFIDLFLVLFTLPVTSILMFLIAIAIKFDTGGKVLFRQARIGQSNREFIIYKFRTMTQNAELDGARLATDKDSRITRLGKILRKSRLDELPQLWNVVKGDMSLIGPRPEQRYFVEQFEQSIPFYTYRHVVKPGLSGWAQVMQGYTSDEESTKTKIQYDFYYIKNFSFWLDMLIFIKTIRVIFTGWGAK